MSTPRDHHDRGKDEDSDDVTDLRPSGSPDDQTPLSAASDAEAPTAPLGRSAALGTLWLTGQKWVVRLSGLITLAVLSRFVAPADFGVVAAAATITPLILLLADLGLSTYIMQTDEVDSRTLSTGFWVSITLGSALATGLILAAPVIADAFNIEGSSNVLRAMAVSVLVTVLASVPIALLKRRMQFKLLAIQTAKAALVAQVVAIAVAVAGGGAWALVGQILVSQAITGALAWRAARWHPRAEFSVPLFVSMATFGIKVVAVELVATARAAAEAAIISNALGAAALGYLSIAQRLVVTAQDVGAAAMVPVTTVAFAKVRESAERLRAGYLKALRIGYAAVAPVLTFVAVGAPTLVPLIFGSEWLPSVPVAQGLAVAAILVLGAMIDHGLHYGVGAPGRWFVYALAVDVLTVATTFVLAPRGLPWVAVGFVAVALIATAVRWVLVSRLVECRATLLAGQFLLSMLPIALSALAGLGVSALTTGLPDLLSLTLVGITIGTVHLLVLYLTSRRVLTETLDVLPIPHRFSGIRRFV